MQSIVSNNLTTATLAVDVLIVAGLLYFCLTLINSQKGWRYLSVAGVGAILLIASDYFSLKGLHLFMQLGLVVLLVAFPLMFKDELLKFLSPTESVLSSDKQPMNAVYQLVVSLVGALLLVAVGQGIATKVDQFPAQLSVTAINLAGGLSASVGSNQQVTIFISAPRSTWSSLTSDNFSAIVDTAKQGQGTYDLPVSVTSKNSNVTVVRVMPTTVSVTIEPVIKKTVPVVAKYSGLPANGLVPDSPVITPAQVEVTGAKSTLDTVTQAVAPVVFNGESGAVDQKVTAQIQDPSGTALSNIIINPQQVEVKLNLVTPGLTKTVGIQPVITGQPSAGFWVRSIATDPTAVTITGTADVLSTVNQLSTASLSVSGISANATLKATLNLPTGITLVNTSIQTVTVSVTLDQTSTTKTVVPTIVYSGLADGLQVTALSPTNFTVLVSGSSSALAALADGAVKVTLDLSAYKSAGAYAVSVTTASFAPPTGISLVSFLPSAINVTLTSK